MGNITEMLTSYTFSRFDHSQLKQDFNNLCFNKQNNRYGNDQNPHWTFKTNIQTV